MVAVHLDHRVRNVKESPRTSGYQDRGDSGFLIEISGTLQKRSDGFFFPADDLLHKRIPDHKISSGGVLVNEKETAVCLHALHGSGGLRRTAAGIQSGKCRGIPLVWKIIDEEGDIHVFDNTSILGTELDGGGVGDDIFPAVSCDVWVDSGFQCFQKGGFSVVAASYDKGDAPWNSHTA